MNDFVRRILLESKVTDSHGQEYPLNQHTSAAQGEFLQDIIRSSGARVGLEVGLAYGISSCFICEALADMAGSKFYSIDPFQATSFHDIGLNNLREAGYGPMVEFFPDYSHCVLPELLKRGVKLDFAYVDTSKVFDVVLVDAYFLIRLLKCGGTIVFDDCAWPGIRKLVRYLALMPNLEVSAGYGDCPVSWKRRLSEAVFGSLPFARSLLDRRLVESEKRLGVNSQCVAFRKISEDTRSWDWAVDF